MTACGRIRPLISFFLEKETDPLETLEVRRHLDGCPSCQARARRLESTMARCDTLAHHTQAVELSGAVMHRLSSLKGSLSPAGARLAAKWSGIGLILAAGLTAMSAHGSAGARLLGRPFAFLVGLVTGGDQFDRLRDLGQRALPFLPGGLTSGVQGDLASSAGLDAAIAIQLLGTALVIGLGLAVPVALLTAWLLHREASAGSGAR